MTSRKKSLPVKFWFSVFEIASKQLAKAERNQMKQEYARAVKLQKQSTRG